MGVFVFQTKYTSSVVVPCFQKMSTPAPEAPQPTVITLDNRNSFQILSQYIELAQQKGAFLLNEAEILKRASDVLLNGVTDADINPASAKNLLIQGVNKGQRHGAYTLNDAALLSRVVQFVSGLPEGTIASAPSPAPAPAAKTPDEDLSELSEPVPLRPKEV